MKTLKTGFAYLLLLSAIACTKSIKEPPTASSANASDLSEATASFTIGQSYHGGIIFYIDNTGQHGLIAATVDQGTGISWKRGANVVTGASGTARGTGASNTAAIIAALGNKGNYAALLCSRYKVGAYTEWYLPSKVELNLMYAKKAIIGNFGASNYWSSSEVSKGKAWDQEFGGGFQFKDNKKFTLNVRAISSF